LKEAGSPLEHPTGGGLPTDPGSILEYLPQAPWRNEEDPLDPYDWIRQLPPEVKLPESELLEALHIYASDFFSMVKAGRRNYRSLDGTALLALGILLEELASESVGNNGDLVFTEGADEDFKPTPTWLNRGREVHCVLAEENAGGLDEKLQAEIDVDDIEAMDSGIVTPDLDEMEQLDGISAKSHEESSLASGIGLSDPETTEQLDDMSTQSSSFDTTLGDES
jgi:hypothetical protein